MIIQKLAEKMTIIQTKNIFTNDTNYVVKFLVFLKPHI